MWSATIRTRRRFPNRCRPSSPAHHEAQYAVVLAGRHEVMAGRSAESRHVPRRRTVGGEKLHDRAGGLGSEHFAQLEHRQRTRQPTRIDGESNLLAGGVIVGHGQVIYRRDHSVMAGLKAEMIGLFLLKFLPGLAL